MNRSEIVLEDLKEFLSELEENKINYIIFGGLAIYLHMINLNKVTNFQIFKSYRETCDIDILVQPDVSKIKWYINKIKRDNKDILDINDYSNEVEITEDTTIDILNSIQGYSYDTMDYRIIDYNGIKLKVATPEVLLRMKLNLCKIYGEGVRDKDKIDIGILEYIIKEESRLNKKDYIGSKKGWLSWF